MKRFAHAFLIITLFTFIVLFSTAVYADAIYVDQLGYLPSQPKIALVSSALGLPFHLIEQPTGTVVYKGMLSLSRANDPDAGAHLWKADFGMWNRTGVYKISVPGLDESKPFAIQNGIYASLGTMALKSFYFQRSGMALESKYAGEWNRTAFHLGDGPIFGASATAHIGASTGGWYDGSDFGKYTVSGCFAAGLLLMQYEMNPTGFPDGSLKIPERENGIPDILDEVKWELDWLFTMQEASGGVYHKITPAEPGELHLPSEKDPPRFRMPVSLTATADFAALFAKAARLFEPFDTHYATRCLRASVDAWNYLMEHPGTKPFENPSGVTTKAYADIDDFEERFWAASELFITTGQQGYQEYLANLAERRVPLLPSSGYWGNPMPLATGAMIANTTAAKGSKVGQELFEDVKMLADTIRQKSSANGLMISLEPEEFAWGSNNILLQNALIMILEERLEGQGGYTHAILDHWHYIMGRNPMQKIYVSGMGETSPKNIYHPIAAVDKAKEPFPGFLVGGPNVNLNDGILTKTFANGIAPALAYIDNAESYASNETSISWNAALVIVASWVAGL